MAELSDLVLDSRLETRFHEKYVYHVHHESDADKGQRSVQRREFWQRHRYLGSGGCGSVWLEKCIKGQQEGAVRAVKEIERPRNKFECNRELEAIAKFSHVKYAKCFAKSFGWYEKGNTFYLAMEYFPLGDLQSYLNNAQDPLPESEVQHISFQTLEGLKFMHDNGFAHRDIKPGNILVQSQPPRDWWVKISDFGISKRFRDSQGISSTVKGTLAFMAPELHGIHPQGGQQSIIPKATDIWALGEITHQLLTKLPVFDNVGALYRFVLATQGFPKDKLREYNVGEGAISFMELIMIPLPNGRLTAEQALQHPWLERLRPAPSPDLPELDIPEVPDIFTDLYPDKLPSAKWTTLDSTDGDRSLMGRLPESIHSHVLSYELTDGAYPKIGAPSVTQHIWFDPDMIGDPKVSAYELGQKFGSYSRYEDFSTLELTANKEETGYPTLRRLALHRYRLASRRSLIATSGLKRADDATGAIGIAYTEDDISRAGVDGCIHHLGHIDPADKNDYSNSRTLELSKISISQIYVAYIRGSGYIAGMTFFHKVDGKHTKLLEWKQRWRDEPGIFQVINRPPERADRADWKFAGLTGSWVNTVGNGYVLSRVSGIWMTAEDK